MDDRTIVKLPACHEPAGIRDFSAARTIEIARRHLIGRLGLIREVREILGASGDAAVFSASCVTAKTSGWLGTDIVGQSGAVGLTWEEACAKAIGECVERYCCASYDWNDLVRASKEDLGSAAIGMDEFQMYAPTQYTDPRFPLAPWDPSRRVHWTLGRSLHTGATCYVPSALVYIPYRLRNPDDKLDLVGLSVSSGQACHTHITRALLSGIYEVVERDAFMIRWLRQLPPVRIDLLTSPAVASIYNRHFRASHVAFDVFDITVDIAIPTVLALATGRSKRGPIVTVGAAAALTEDRAIVKALQESFQGMVWARDLLIRQPDWAPGCNYSNVRTFDDHVRFYCEPDTQRFLDFIVSTPHLRPAARSIEFDSAEDELARALAIIAKANLDVVAVDTTSPEIAAIGFHCPKVFIPGTVPLTSVHALQALGSDRLHSVPTRLGFHVDDLPFNPVPHPFP